jgi:Ca2+-binding RTX toxin-like protein
MPTFTGGVFGNDFDQLDIISLGLGAISNASGISFADSLNSQIDNFYGGGFVYGANGFPTAGTVSEVHEIYSGNPVFDLTGLNLPITTILGWAATGADETARLTVFAGSDLINGSNIGSRLRGYDGDDTINGGAGNDFLDGGGGNDQVFGGAGNDVVVDGSGTNYLRGGEGDDVILGGTGFDDANGNMGNDTISTGAGDDYSVGGKDNDLLFGDAGNDIVWGNLGNDTCDGGDGNDQVRGGQGDDSVSGGPGADFVSGDRGNDTISGGSGADNFHGSQDAGIDRVLDFNLAEGDRVQLDPGTIYTVGQVGADTVIDMGGANQMILVGVQFSTLTPGWIFLG